MKSKFQKYAQIVIEDLEKETLFADKKTDVKSIEEIEKL